MAGCIGGPASNERNGVVAASRRRAFSCGLLLTRLVRGRVSSCIANVCTISDYAPYANLDGSVDPVAEVTLLRAAEDARFFQELDKGFLHGEPNVQLLDLGWRDAPLRHSIAAEAVLAGGTIALDEVARLVADFRCLAPTSIVLAPMALGGHLDHSLVREAAVEVWPKDILLFYEDLPYACRMSPEVCAEQTRRCLPWPCERAPASPAQSGEKRRMALCYPSQIAAAVADEMQSHAAALGWTERLYGTQTALRRLTSLSRGREIDEDNG